MSFSTLFFILIFTPTKHTLKEEVGMAELGMSLIWMVGLEFWFFWVLCFFFFSSVVMLWFSPMMGWSGFWSRLIWVDLVFFFFFNNVFVSMGFWWVVGSGGMVGMVEVQWWWLGSGGVVLKVEEACELVRATDTRSDKLLIRNWGWMRTREKHKERKKRKKYNG